MSSVVGLPALWEAGGRSVPAVEDDYEAGCCQVAESPSWRLIQSGLEDNSASFLFSLIS